MSDSKKDQPEEISKSQRKRDMTALQKIGEELINLSDSQLAQIPLDVDFLEAIQFARSLTSHEAIRRQLQYIGKLMREMDVEAIQASLKKLHLTHKKNVSEFHEVEKWRDQLVAEGDAALQQFLGVCPEADRQKLRQLIRNSQHDEKTNKNSGAKAELFKYLRELLKQ